MRYLGIDLGSKTVGLAMSDPTATIASSFKTIFFSNEDYKSTIPEIKQIVTDYNIKKIILGLPKNMNNTLGERAEITLKYKELLEENISVPVELLDERLTSVISNSILIEADISRKKRKKKVDSIAAQIILQDYLNKEKNKNDKENTFKIIDKDGKEIDLKYYLLSNQMKQIKTIWYILIIQLMKKVIQKFMPQYLILMLNH